MMTLKTTLLGITLALGINQFAKAENGRKYESNLKIDRIQVNKMKALKREFKEEVHYGNFRQAKFIKYDVILLAEKDIRFQQKKIRDLKRKLDRNNDHPYYKKSQTRRSNNRHYQNGYYDRNSDHCGTDNFNRSEARQELRTLKRLLQEKRELLHELKHNHSRHSRTFNKDLRVLRALIHNMQDDVSLHYNNNVDSQYYRRRQ